jgi:hypothetical protein
MRRFPTKRLARGAVLDAKALRLPSLQLASSSTARWNRHPLVRVLSAVFGYDPFYLRYSLSRVQLEKVGWQQIEIEQGFASF